MTAPFSKSRCILAVAVASAAAGLSMHSHAQNQPTALEEVVVTAQKREQNYLDVPVSVNTFSGEVLDMAKVNEFQDLVQVSPSVTFTQTGGMRGSGVLIRGIGTTAFQIAVEPTVATVVDGITMGRTGQSLMDLDDIAQVEILRGPQGTLFGKNATGGLFMVNTNDPTEEFESRFRAMVTDDDGYVVSGVVSGAIADGVRGRLGVYSKGFDGFGDNAFRGTELNGDDSWGVRGKLAIDLSDRADLMLIADVSEQDRNCCQSFFSAGDEGPVGDALEAEYAAFGVELSEKNTVWLDSSPTFSNTETWGVSAEFNVEFDQWRFVSITGAREFTLATEQGVDGLPYYAETARTAPAVLSFDSNGSNFIEHPEADLPGGTHDQDQFSQEFRLESNNWEKMNLTLGAFYWNQTVDRYFHRVSQLAAFGGGLGPFYGWMDAVAETESYALFGSMDYKLTDDLTLLAGLRYTDDEISADIDRVTPSPGPAVAASATGSNTVTETDLSGRLGLQYSLNDDWMIYATATTGYKSPAFDLIFSATQERLDNPVPAEEVTAYELGIKGEFWDGRARIGATLFNTSFDNYQGQGFDEAQVQFLLISAGEVTTEGFETDITLKPTAGWLINAGYAYTDAIYESYAGAQCYPGQSEAEGCFGGAQDISGNQVANAPKHKFTLQTRYDMDLSSSFLSYVGGSYRYQSDSPSDLNGDPRTERESYGILDLFAGVESTSGSWQAEFFVKNALDNFYVDRPTYSSLLSASAGYLNRDSWRYMGVEFNYRFGRL